MEKSRIALIAAILNVFIGNISAQAEQRVTVDDQFSAFSESLTQVPATETLTTEGMFYAPAFSSIRMEGGKTRLDLAVTLSIHNASETKALVLNQIDYFNTAGALVQRFLTRSIALRPFGTLEVFIPADDIRGGTGANFLVAWAASGAIAEPIIETVMIGSIGTRGYSFVASGRGLRIVQAQNKSD